MWQEVQKQALLKLVECLENKIMQLEASVAQMIEK